MISKGNVFPFVQGLRPGILAAGLACMLLPALVPGCSSTKKRYDQPLAPGQAALELVEQRSRYPHLERLTPRDPQLIAALDESLAYFAKPSSQQHFPYQTSDRQISHEVQIRTLETLRAMLLEAQSPQELASWIDQHFDVYRSVGWDGWSGEVLFTGYYTPIFAGSRERHGPFQYPIYRRPADLVATEDGKPLGRRLPDGEIVPYPARREIEEGQLLSGLELVYLTDPFDVYIVHVQGSATIRLEDGSDLHIGYNGKTDRPYRSIGQELIRRGRMRDAELSLASLRSYFRKHPQEVQEVLSINQSYVFFAESEPGPFGSIGARVTPYHTIATDKQVFPRGGPVIVETLLPDPNGRRPSAHTGMYLDQDTGGAIRSAGRADLYLGRGAEAEQIAGHTRNEGRLFYLFLKEGAPGLASGTEPQPEQPQQDPFAVDLRGSGR